MPVTKIPRRGSKKSFGKLPSKKVGRLVCWRSQLQRDYLYLLEADRAVTRYEEQPRVIQYTLGGRVRRYTPSFEVERNGRVYVVEVRPAERVAAAEDFEAFRREMARVCRQQGLGRFVVLTEADIRQQPLLDNVKLLFRYSRMPFNFLHRVMCLQYLQGGYEASVGEIAGHLAAGGVRGAVQVVYALIYAGHLAVDLTSPVGLESPAWLAGIPRPGRRR